MLRPELARLDRTLAPPAGFTAGVDNPYAKRLRALIAAHADELTAVIVEPVVQGAGGMRFHDPGYLRLLRSVCSDAAAAASACGCARSAT
jgi:adenosylmethionine-8-amino-7-oxononanoate aminotransferase